MGHKAHFAPITSSSVATLGSDDAAWLTYLYRTVSSARHKFSKTQQLLPVRDVSIPNLEFSRYKAWNREGLLILISNKNKVQIRWIALVREMLTKRLQQDYGELI